MTASELGRKLVDHDGISKPEARTQRRQQMESILDNERTVTRRLRLVAMLAWASTLLIPMAGVIFAVIPARGNEGMYAAVMLFGLLGGLAVLLAVLTTVAWLFRSRATTMSAIEMRLASLEDLLERVTKRE